MCLQCNAVIVRRGSQMVLVKSEQQRQHLKTAKLMLLLTHQFTNNYKDAYNQNIFSSSSVCNTKVLKSYTIALAA